MALLPSAEDVEAWLEADGWFPGRDIGARADELIGIRVRDASAQGAPLTVFPRAVEFVRSFGELRLADPADAGRALWLRPTIGYDGDAADIGELAAGLGKALFPVGLETGENGILLVDDDGRLFYLHHTGGYFLGETPASAFAQWLSGRAMQDAEDFFA
ncbi:SUKH-3 domain-containing protein [Kitasatospora sp. NPDC088134]|uniref:SUKH-3 domain-containing protein n=1 Tax=Kitasatospora sp. NPDC088134 TaxID=3364071 RepID=UPI003801A8CD